MQYQLYSIRDASSSPPLRLFCYAQAFDRFGLENPKTILLVSDSPILCRSVFIQPLASLALTFHTASSEVILLPGRVNITCSGFGRV